MGAYINKDLKELIITLARFVSWRARRCENAAAAGH